MGLILVWRTSKGNFNEIVKPIADAREMLRSETNRLLNKWFRDDEDGDFYFVVLVEINTKLFDPTNIKKSRKAKLDYRLKVQ